MRHRRPRRRITRTLGAAAGGLLGAAFLPAAAAFADDYVIVPDSGSTEVLTGIYGSQTAPPAVDETVEGYQLFDVKDTTLGTVVGTFHGDESTASDSFGDIDKALLVTSTSDPTGTAAGDVPPVGSVFDTYTFGDTGYANIYSDLASTTPGADVISDTLVTPFGDITIPVTFDAAVVAAADAGAGALADDYGIVPDPTSAETITAIGGVPPLDVAIQGTQQFDVGTGTFDAAKTTTMDIFGTQTEALLVTSTSDPTGTAAGDVPPVGSVFNVINPGYGFENVYSDLPSPSGDVISDTVVTPFGDFTLPTTFDAAAVPNTDAVAVALADAYGIVPASTEEFTGINGVPPLDVAIQGTQQFGVGTGGTGTFDADVSTASDSLGDIDEAIRVTSTSDPTGTAAGDVPPVGSVFDTYALGDTGFENIYAVLASTTPGADVISDTLVTPLGDITIPLASDAAVAAADSFLMLP